MDEGGAMLTKFIEVTIVSDSADTSAHARKASVRADQITSFVDISAEKFSGHPLVRISLAEPHDFLNSDDEAGGVVRAQRTIFVQESYETIQRLLFNVPTSA
jgi:hypothetical protein